MKFDGKLDVDADTAGFDRRLVVRAVVVCIVVTAAMLAVYYTLPWSGGRAAAVTVRIAIVVAVLVAATVVSMHLLVRSERPSLFAAQALAGLATFAVVAFAATYRVLSEWDALAFSEALGATDALYFSVTLSTTVGFGDIHAKSEPARVAVMIHMVVNVVVIGVAARLLLSAARGRGEGSTRRSEV